MSELRVANSELGKEPGTSGILSYRDLNVWKAAIELSVDCYQVTQSFPPSEMYGMVAQIRRASASIAANIAEGHGREGTQQFIQFLRVAQGPLKELETHLIICERVSLMERGASGRLLKRCDDIGRMLRSLIRSLQDRR